MSKRILILGRHEKKPSVDKVEDFVRLMQPNASDASVECAYYEELYFELINGEVLIKTSHQGEDIANFDVVFMMGWFLNFREEALGAAIYLKNKGVKFFNREALKQRSLSKLTQYINLSYGGIPIPDTIYTRRSYNLNQSEVIDILGLPLIYKRRGGSRGDHNYLLNDKEELSTMIESQNSKFLIQRFVPNDGDLRVIVMNGKVARVIKRNTVEGSHLSNTSQGGAAEILPIESLSDDVTEMCIKSSDLCDREFTGVDVMFNKTDGKPCILEVNNMPQLVSGAFVAEKVESLTQALMEVTE